MIVDLITSPSLASQGPQTIRFCSNTCALHQTYGSRTPTTLRNVTSGGSLGPRICFCHRDISKAHEVTSRTDPPEAAQTRTGAGSSRHKTGGTSSDNQDISQLLRLRSACRRNRPNKAQISSSDYTLSKTRTSSHRQRGKLLIPSTYRSRVASVYWISGMNIEQIA